MRPIFLILKLLAFALPVAASASAKKCVCTCVVMDDGKFVTYSGQGADRVKAGESLKKAIGKKKCELSPDCTGKCKLDDE